MDDLNIWKNQIIKFVKYVLQENDDIFIDSSFQEFFSTFPGGYIENFAATDWILEYQIFKNLYYHKPHDFLNFIKTVFEYHYGSDIESIWANTVLIGKGYSFKSKVNNKVVLIDRKFINNLHQYFKEFDHR